MRDTVKLAIGAAGSALLAEPVRFLVRETSLKIFFDWGFDTVAGQLAVAVHQPRDRVVQIMDDYVGPLILSSLLVWVVYRVARWFARRELQAIPATPAPVPPPVPPLPVGGSASLKAVGGTAEGNLLIAPNTTIDVGAGRATRNVQMAGFSDLPTPRPKGLLSTLSDLELIALANNKATDLKNFEKYYNDYHRSSVVKNTAEDYLRKVTEISGEFVYRIGNIGLPKMSYAWFGARIISQQHIGGAFVIRSLYVLIDVLAEKLSEKHPTTPPAAPSPQAPAPPGRS